MHNRKGQVYSFKYLMGTKRNCIMEGYTGMQFTNTKKIKVMALTMMHHVRKKEGSSILHMQEASRRYKRIFHLYM